PKRQWGLSPTGRLGVPREPTACPFRLRWRGRCRPTEGTFMEGAILIMALLFVAFVALGVCVTDKVVGAAKRGVERTVTQARRTVEDTTLKAKSVGQPGVAGQLAQLRLSLRSSMRATQEAL